MGAPARAFEQRPALSAEILNLHMLLLDYSPFCQCRRTLPVESSLLQGLAASLSSPPIFPSIFG